MRKAYQPLPIMCLLGSFLLLPVVKAGDNTADAITISINSNTSEHSAKSISYTSKILYDSLDLGRLGLSRDALSLAYKGFQELNSQGKLDNPDLLTVIDFTQPSDNKRLYILDIKNFRVLLNTYVAHGKNSGLSYASRFSNDPRSLQSSLGFYITKNIYFGKHGLSLRLSGQERGYNDNAEERAVVIHGANYIGEQHLGAPYMGRSFGCPAVPLRQAPRIINLIKDGTCLFIYHPSKGYLHGSRILNG